MRIEHVEIEPLIVTALTTDEAVVDYLIDLGRLSYDSRLRVYGRGEAPMWRYVRPDCSVYLIHYRAGYADRPFSREMAAIFRADILAEQEGRPLPPIPVGDTEAKDGKPC